MSRTQGQEDPVDHAAHDAAMAELGGEGTEFISGKPQPGSEAEFQVDPAATPAADGRPENVPEKFWDAEKGEIRTEAMLEAYKTLESNRGKPDVDEAEAPAEEAAADSTDDAAADLPESLVDKAQSEYEESGQLTEETYKSLEAQGINKDTVDAYMTGLEATRQLAFMAAGSEENYAEMTEWAGTALTETEISAYNSALEGTPAEMASAIQAMAARYAEGKSVEPSLVAGDNAAPTINGYNSKAEMVAAMSDPRYKSDANFRSEVAKKIAAAESRGVNITM